MTLETLDGTMVSEQDAPTTAIPNCTSDYNFDDIEFVDYVDESQLEHVMKLVLQDLSEPYSIFTYRYFLHRFPELCILAFPKGSGEPIGCVVGKIDQEEMLLPHDHPTIPPTQQQQRLLTAEVVTDNGTNDTGTINNNHNTTTNNNHNNNSNSNSSSSITEDSNDNSARESSSKTTNQSHTSNGSSAAASSTTTNTTTTTANSNVVPTGYIGMLAVQSAYRRRGIGKALVRQVLHRMKLMGCTSVTLETEVSNTTAQRLYQDSFGFVREELLVRYYLNWGDAYRLRLWF